MVAEKSTVPANMVHRTISRIMWGCSPHGFLLPDTCRHIPEYCGSHFFDVDDPLAHESWQAFSSFCHTFLDWMY
jgi:hypothetical protein